jgi:hypothetical protein
MRLLSSILVLFIYAHITFGQISATVTSEKHTLYTIQPAHYSIPFTWIQTIASTGIAPISDLTLNYKVTKNGQVYLDQTDTLALDAGEIALDTFQFSSTEYGKYLVIIRASHPILGNNFFSEFYSVEVNESILARDDGSRESALGFGFGDPAWYGYYGSEFFLPDPDTLVGISIFKVTSGPGEIHLTVSTFEETGQSPDVELYHSEAIDIATGSSWVYHELEDPLLLYGGRYVVAAGQDTVQGIIGFGFDQDHITQDGFWIVSPIAGGGYPWAQIFDRETLMIRPHFAPRDLSTSVQEVAIDQFDLKISPNPFAETLDLVSKVDETLFCRIMDSGGRLHHQIQLAPNETRVENLHTLPSGLYFLIISDGKKYAVKKIIKQ